MLMGLSIHFYLMSQTSLLGVQSMNVYSIFEWFSLAVLGIRRFCWPVFRCFCSLGSSSLLNGCSLVLFVFYSSSASFLWFSIVLTGLLFFFLLQTFPLIFKCFTCPLLSLTCHRGFMTVLLTLNVKVWSTAVRLNCWGLFQDKQDHRIRFRVRSSVAV